MAHCLLIDIGAGTMDVLCANLKTQSCFKAVVKSPVRAMAEKIAAHAGPLAVSGVEMGGGSVSQALKNRARQHHVAITAAAAKTVHNDLARVQSMGLEILPDDQVAALAQTAEYEAITLSDLDLSHMQQLVNALGIPFEFDIVGICAQDHGCPPPGVSHLDHRHHLFCRRLDQHPSPHTLLYPAARIPASLTRLQTLANTAQNLPARQIFVADSGMAAIIGASKDPAIDSTRPVLVLDIATSHTLGAVMAGDELLGFFEYHTSDINRALLEQRMIELADGKLSHESVVAGGGHGAWISRAPGFATIADIIATGPQRRVINGSKLPVRFGAPLGDHMMTGCAGLLDAICRHENLPTPDYV